MCNKKNYLSPYIVLCEGESEFNYITSLNRILCFRNNPYAILFKAVLIGSGKFVTVKREYDKALKNNKKEKDNILIWIDYDIYQRNENDNNTLYKNKLGIPDFLFSYMNFEDFLILHLSKNVVDEWYKKCKDHFFYNPKSSKEYLPLFKKYFCDYKKGELPIQLNKNTLENMFKNLNEFNNYKNDFASFLSEKISSGLIVYKEDAVYDFFSKHNGDL
ncbi:MAG: hypothetical protein U0O25_04735 [Succinivibrio sp.]|uniref:hypothetical protein n=1 Tax=Succinivibrio sp. TaxID=2053619 RepID=UPI002F95DD12